MGALAYLDGRYFLNQLRSIVRSPGRLALWTPYVLALAFLMVRRFAVAGGHTPGIRAFGAADALGTAAAGAFLAILGVTIGVAAGGRVSAFRSTAEALLVVNGGVAPLSIALWLQFRKLASTGARWLGSIVFSFLLIAPPTASSQQLARGFVAALAVAGAIMTVELPAFLLARKRFGGWVAVAGWTIAAVGGFYAALGFATSIGDQRFAPQILDFVGYDPGDFVSSVVSSWTGPVLLCCVPLALIAAIAVLGRDAVPELYAATRRTFEWRARQRDVKLVDLTSSTSAERIPAGSLTVVWKDWIGFRRSQGGWARWLFSTALWLGLGGGIAYANAQDDHELALPLLGLAMTAVVLVPLAASVSLVEDLAKPIWWVSASSLRSRVIAWAFAKAWRNGLSFGTLPLALAVAEHDIAGALLALPLGVVLWSSLNALGVALYAAYPSRLDARGPIFFVRALTTGVFLLPAGMVFGVTSMISGSILAAGALASITLLVEALLAVEFAVYRFRENGAGISMLERA